MQGFWDKLGAALAALIAFFLGRDEQADNQREADLQQKVKELKTDAKNRDDVAGLTDSQRADELRNPPPARR